MDRGGDDDEIAVGQCGKGLPVSAVPRLKVVFLAALPCRLLLAGNDGHRADAQGPQRLTILIRHPACANDDHAPVAEIFLADMNQCIVGHGLAPPNLR